ncbi:twin-arginine translocase TatA/TatE family subunit [Cellulomonas sp. P5_C5]
MFGINGGELLVLLVVAALVIGPERLPGYAEQLGQWVRRGRRFIRDAKARVDEELGDEVGDVDWAALDPRKYDPRRIVRDALLEDDEPVRPVSTPATRPRTGAAAARAATGGAAAAAATGGAGTAPASTPYDDEAT